MESIHDHKMLNMTVESGEQYLNASPEAAVTARLDKRARLHICSAADMTTGELVTLLTTKGKLIAEGDGFSTYESEIRRRWFQGAMMAGCHHCPKILILCIKRSQFFIDEIKTFATSSCQRRFISNRFE